MRLFGMTRVVGAVTVMAVAIAGCGAQGSEKVATGTGPTTSAADAGGGQAMFGDAASPCGPGDATVKPGEAGVGNTKLYIGAASDKGAQIRPGLLGEMYDAGAAFAQWCNAQGGIAGLKIEVVDLDGKLLEVSKAMVTACRDTFAMVGGGNALDAGQFSGKSESDFHKCHLIDIAGFANQPEKADSNGYVAPVPNRTSPRSVTFWQEFAEEHPDDIAKSVIVYSDAVSYNKDQMVSTLKAVPGWKVVDEINYPAAGNVDFKLVSQRVRQSGAKVVNLVGEPASAVQLFKAMHEDGVDPWVLMETNFYTDDLKTIADITDKAVVRMIGHPFEEADRWPATRDYVKMMEDYRKAGHPQAKIASLGVQSTSAWLLFATAAAQCGREGDHVISRDCVLANAKKVHKWSGHGLHATTDPGDNMPSACIMTIGLRKGEWTRLEPKIGSSKDAGEGFICRDDGVKPLPDMEAKYKGRGAVDPTRTA